MWTHGAPRARLVLENGSVWHGYAFGAEGPCLGEDVFNTNMTGYQEIITDSIYAGQIGSMTASKLATSASMPITTRPDGLSCGLSPRRPSGCFASSSRPTPAASARRCPLVPRDGLRLWHQAQHPAPLGKPRLPRHRRLGGVSSKPCSKKRVNDSWRGFLLSRTRSRFSSVWGAGGTDAHLPAKGLAGLQNVSQTQLVR